MCLLCFYLRINNMDDFRAPVAEHRTPNMVLINTTLIGDVFIGN